MKSLPHNEIAQIVKAEIDERTRRCKLLPAGYYCEPSWAILLEVFLGFLQGNDVYTKHAVLSANCPATTALRYINFLEERGLIRRFVKSDDARAKILFLTSEGLERMNAFFEHRSLAQRSQWTSVGPTIPRPMGH